MFNCHQAIIWFPLMLSHFLLTLHWNTLSSIGMQLVLERIYNRGELVTNITRSEMKEILLLCTKNAQKDGIAMGSPLGPVLAGIFMVNLDRSLVPKLNVYLNFWRRYVDDAITVIEITCAEYLLSVLNNFHPKIKFTYEMEVDSELAFSDILLHRDDHDIITTVIEK